MDLTDVAIGVAAVALVYGLGLATKRIHLRHGIPLRIVVDADCVAVESDGHLLFRERPVLRYRMNRAGLPRLLNFTDDSEDNPDSPVHVYKLSGDVDEGHKGVVDTFIAGCCLKAWTALAKTPLRAMRVQFVSALSEAKNRATLIRQVHPERLKKMGVHVEFLDEPALSTPKDA